jgi:hypothetical protein
MWIKLNAFALGRIRKFFWNHLTTAPVVAEPHRLYSNGKDHLRTLAAREVP